MTDDDLDGMDADDSELISSLEDDSELISLLEDDSELISGSSLMTDNLLEEVDFF